MSASEHRPGDFPEVHDEAPDTPAWVPILGVGLLAVISLFAVYRAATAEEEPAADVQVVIGAEEAPAEAAPQPAPPQPAADPHAGHGH